MKCDKTLSTLYAYSKNELSPAQALKIAEHLKICPACSAQYKSLTGLQTMFATAIENPSARVLHNIRSAAGDKPFSLFRPAYALSFSAALFLCVFGISVLFNNAKHSEANAFLDETYSSIYEAETPEHPYVSDYHLEDIGLSDAI